MSHKEGSRRDTERSIPNSGPREHRDRYAGRQKAALATVAIMGTSYFIAVLAALHFLSPETDPIQRPTSEYAVGPFGYLMTSRFVALSLSTWALVVGLSRDLSGRARSRLGLALLAVFGTGLLVAASFPIDLEGAPATLAGTIHSINGPIAS